MNFDHIDGTERVAREAWEDDWRLPVVEAALPEVPERVADGTRTKLAAAPPPIPVAALRRMAEVEVPLDDLAAPPAAMHGVPLDDIQPTTPFKRPQQEWGIPVDDVELPQLQARERAALPTPRRATTSQPIQPIAALVGAKPQVTFQAEPRRAVDPLASTYLPVAAAPTRAMPAADPIGAPPPVPELAPAMSLAATAPAFTPTAMPVAPPVPYAPMSLAATAPAFTPTAMPVAPYPAYSPPVVETSRPAQQMWVVDEPMFEDEPIAPIPRPLAPKLVIGGAAVAVLFALACVVFSSGGSDATTAATAAKATPAAAPAPRPAEAPPPAPTERVATPAAPAAPAPEAAPARVDVSISSTPAGASVTLVDAGTMSPVGVTPLELSLDATKGYDVILTMDGKATRIQHLAPGANYLAVNLGEPARDEVPAPRPAAPKVASAPPPARPQPPVAKAVATAPAPAQPASGSAGTLMISTKPPCEIVIDGKPTHKTTPQRALSLPAGRHTILLVNKPQHLQKTMTVLITAGQATRLIQSLM